MTILDEVGASIRQVAEGAGTSVVGIGQRWGAGSGIVLGEGFYLAIPADEALRGRADALARGESAESPRLGVAIAPGHVARRLRRAVGLPDTEGLLIREVMEDSPAASAGLAQGDLIVAAAGQPIRTPDDLFDALRAASGGTIELSIVRGTDERVIQVAFAGNGQPGQEA